MSNKIRNYIIEDTIKDIAFKLRPTEIVYKSPYGGLNSLIDPRSVDLDLELGVMSYNVLSSYEAGVDNWFRYDEGGNVLKSNSVQYDSVDDAGRTVGYSSFYQIIIVWKDWEEKIQMLLKSSGIRGEDVRGLNDLPFMTSANSLQDALNIVDGLEVSLKWKMLEDWDVAVYCPCAAFHWQHYKMSKARDGRLAVKSDSTSFTSPGELIDLGVWRSRHGINSGNLCKHLYYSLQELGRDPSFLEEIISKVFVKYKKDIERYWQSPDSLIPDEEPDIKDYIDYIPPEEQDPEEYKDFIGDVIAKRYKADPRKWDEIGKSYGISGEAARKRAFRADQSMRSKGAESPYLQKAYHVDRRVKGIKKVEDYFDGDFFRSLFEVMENNVST